MEVTNIQVPCYEVPHLYVKKSPVFFWRVCDLCLYGVETNMQRVKCRENNGLSWFSLMGSDLGWWVAICKDKLGVKMFVKWVSVIYIVSKTVLVYGTYFSINICWLIVQNQNLSSFT